MILPFSQHSQTIELSLMIFIVTLNILFGCSTRSCFVWIDSKSSNHEIGTRHTDCVMIGELHRIKGVCTHTTGNWEGKNVQPIQQQQKAKSRKQKSTFCSFEFLRIREINPSDHESLSLVGCSDEPSDATSKTAAKFWTPILLSRFSPEDIVDLQLRSITTEASRRLRVCQCFNNRLQKQDR